MPRRSSGNLDDLATVVWLSFLAVAGVVAAVVMLVAIAKIVDG